MTPTPRRRGSLFPGAWIFLAVLSVPCTATAGANELPAPTVEAQLARFQPVHMPFDTTLLTARQQQLLVKLVEATRLLDELFWQQSDPAGFDLYRSLAGSEEVRDQQLRRLLRINGGRYDLIREYAPFAGAGARPPGAYMYPPDLTRAEFDAWVERHPEQRTALYAPYAVVRRRGEGLEAVPYHVAYRPWLEPMARALREAAALSDDRAFAAFLRLRAAALLNDDYLQSDLAWVDLKNPQFDLIYAPYETYLDGFLGVKGTYGAAVLVRNEPESRKLEVFQKYVADIQEALPLPAADRPSKRGHVSPMEVMDTPYRGGDLRHGYQAVADNLPNDRRVHEMKGSKKIFFKNYLDARVSYVILPIARRLMKEDQVHLATADGYLATTLMHEIAHGLGPTVARTPAGTVDIREAIGAEFAALEEATADIVGLFALKWLVDRGQLPQDKLAECYATQLAGIFRTVRFGVAEAHGRAEIMEFNFFVERGVILQDAATGRYAVDFAGMPAAVDALAKELLEQEASGDRARVEAWFRRYGSMPAHLSAALETVGDVPIDIDPTSDFQEL